MLKIHIPEFGDLELAYLILDYNGTLAVNGILLTGLVPIINLLAQQLEVHIVTGDTYGTAKDQLKGINCKLMTLPAEKQSIAKLNYIESLEPDKVIAIGNGRNDKKLLKEAKIGIAVLGTEGTAAETICAADIVMLDIYSALNLIQNPRQLIATLRG